MGGGAEVARLSLRPGWEQRRIQGGGAPGRGKSKPLEKSELSLGLQVVHRFRSIKKKHLTNFTKVYKETKHCASVGRNTNRLEPLGTSKIDGQTEHGK